MRACPCCREMLTPGLLGLGGRRLAGHCEACGEAVCQSCLSTQVLEAAIFRKRAAAPGQERKRVSGRVCRSCLWEVLTDRDGTAPFPAPAGQRERAARAARESCSHPRVKQWMGFCPDCGDEAAWKAEHGNPACDACGAPSHRFFNHCWACGESFDEENEPQSVARGYRLDFDCEASGCTGKLAWLMPHCPWCGEARHWQHAGGLDCDECGSSIDRAWAFCVGCGEEAPLPDDCPRCGQELEKAQSAARCEDCRNIVCGDCFDFRTVPGESHEKLLCEACGSGFDAASESAEEPEAPVEPEAADEPEEAPEDEPEDGPDEEPEDEPDEEPEDEPDEEPEEAPPAARPPSPWEVLGVTPQTPLPEVKRAYLALVAQYHPDKVAQLGPKLQALAQEETRRIIEAWERVRRQSR